MLKSLAAKIALGAGVLVVGAAAAVWFRPPMALQPQLGALGDTHVRYVKPIQGRPTPGHPGYVNETGKKARPEKGPKDPGWQYNNNYVPTPYTGPLPTIAYGPAQQDAPGFKYRFLANPPATYSLNGGPVLMAPGAAQVAEEAALAMMTDNLRTLVALTDRSPREVSSLTHMVETNAQASASKSWIAYSFQVTGISIDPACTDNMPAPGAEPCWDVSYTQLFTASGYTGKQVLAGTVTIATGLKPPDGAILMNIASNTNSVSPAS
jgi:hypothetical protein